MSSSISSTYDFDLWTQLGVLKNNLDQSAVSLDRVVADADDELVQKACNLIVAMIGRRLRSCADFVGYPWVFAGLAGADQVQILERMKADRANWDLINSDAGKFNGPWWKKIKARSHMMMMKVQQYFILAEKALLCLDFLRVGSLECDSYSVLCWFHL